ncbi:MAG: Citrate transporter [Methanosaeta sp. PtaB.Bin018]|jgi:Na+/H+ antiporter NhaD/arsenite permease-like protein|nr:MAG: Citrate transporter [Methanosaeta sp. PtaB.Bin018]OPY43384.1 MAG: Citrate transporter [Methanosaeta sp. PtaU1.Bin016]
MHPDADISILVLSAVLLLIAIRQVGKFSLQIWQIMLLGAIAVLFTGEISLAQAARAINLDVMIFLAGMFVVGQSMQESGYLLHLSYCIFRRAGNVDQLLLLILFGMGALSALLMNDTLAIIGTPLMIYFARTQGISPKLLLLSLAFAVTTGSAVSPIGNPQNLLIAINGDLTNPFLIFSQYLLLPTVANLLLAYLLLKFFYKSQFKNKPLQICQEQIEDSNLAHLSKISFALLILLIFIKITTLLFGVEKDVGLTYIAIVSALPILLFSPRRWEIIKKIDWCTLIFFASMFILMDSVWSSGVFQAFMAKSQADLASVSTILALSVLLSQLISNVPFVALCQPMLVHPSARDLMALAAGSTIAGNLFILGAASNIIIIQNAERSGETLTFLEFARVGVPLTILNVLVYWIFL